MIDVHYPAIDSQVGNPEFGGPASIYALGAQADGRVWGSTVLPIHIFSVVSPLGLQMHPWGRDRDVPLVGDRGEAYTFVERDGEMWAGLYCGSKPVVNLTQTQGHDIEGVSRAWRPKMVATDGQRIWWGGNNGDELGVIVAQTAEDSFAKHEGVFPQVPMCADYHDGIVYVCGSGEGMEGADPTPRLYALDPETLTVLWNCRLAGTRPLSMLRMGHRYIVLCHLTSDTVPRLVMVDTQAQAREWAIRQEHTTIFGRSRNSLCKHRGQIYALADDGVHVIDTDAQEMRLVEPLAKQGGKIANLVASSTLGLAYAVDNQIHFYQPGPT